MPGARIDVDPQVPADLVSKIDDIRAELGVPTAFPPEVTAEAEALAANPPSFADRVDRTDIPFVTIDPASSMDLDQALHIERDGRGFVVYYAIADVGAWVTPGGAIDREAHSRGQTYYAPNSRSPLHPPQLSEGAASLLADGVARPAMLWQLTLDPEGRLTDTKLTRALVRNRAKLDYVGVQQQIDEETASDSLMLLREVGRLRQQIELDRGGISLNLPQQEIEADGDRWRLEYRTLLPVENWNAQISLLTGIAAAGVMIDARVGVLRTLPPTTEADLKKLRHVAKLLRVEWKKDWDYPTFVRSLNPALPNHLAMVMACTTLFRGAGYTSFDGELPDANLKHAALATTYAHTTAPLRRLVDRFVLEICHACLNGLEIPAWAREALQVLPDEMATSDQRAKRFERAVIDATEVLLLRGRVGERFEGVVTQVNRGSGVGKVQLAEPAVEARATGLKPDSFGREVIVKLVSADMVEGRVEFKAV